MGRHIFDSIVLLVGGKNNIVGPSLEVVPFGNSQVMVEDSLSHDGSIEGRDVECWMFI